MIEHSDENPKLRLTDPESPEALARQLVREQRTTNQAREFGLDQSLGTFRVGSVQALNAVPLTRGLEEQVVYAPPSRLAAMLQQDQLDAALVSVVEPLLNDRYDILDGIAVASLGEVRSVFLAHRKPLIQARVVYCDPASLTSVTLLKVLLAEKGIVPEFKALESYSGAGEKDFVLLIGDQALDFAFAPHDHELYDLGVAWYELTQLPFVYAVWALRRGIENRALRRVLLETRDFGLDTLDHIIRNRTEYSEDFRKDYLNWHIHFHLGEDEKRGITKFIQLLRKHGFGPVYEPKFVV